MSSQRRRFLVRAVSALVAPAIGAHAHDDHPHDRSTPRAAKAEQKAWGIAGKPQAIQRTIDVRMSDAMRFTPERIRVRLGETVRLRVHNDGQVLHEFVLGTRPENEAHAALMVKFPGMEHDEPYMAHVRPGQRGEIVWTFNRAGEYEFACLIAGHYQAGMFGRVTVE
jgi:uncharacterized cupredoxin-like copper-binding protein